MEGNPIAAQRVTPLTQDDLSALVAFDARHFGARREALLAASLHLYADRVFVTRDEAGEITGYLVAQEQRFGPWVAATPEAAEALAGARADAPVYSLSERSRSGAELRRHRFARTLRLQVITRAAPHALWRRASAPAA